MQAHSLADEDEEDLVEDADSGLPERASTKTQAQLDEPLPKARDGPAKDVTKKSAPQVPSRPVPANSRITALRAKLEADKAKKRVAPLPRCSSLLAQLMSH